MKFSSTVPMVRPRTNCTFIADSLTMVPIDIRWRIAAFVAAGKCRSMYGRDTASVSTLLVSSRTTACTIVLPDTWRFAASVTCASMRATAPTPRPTAPCSTWAWGRRSSSTSPTPS